MPISATDRPRAFARVDTLARKSAGGFSLVEITIVVAIVALLAGLSTVSFRPLTARLQLLSEAREIEAILATTRSRSIAEGRSLVVSFDAARRVMMFGAPPRQRSVAAELLAPANSRDGRFRIVFHADGSSGGGGFMLRSGARRAEVTVDWLTGRTAVTEVR